MESSLDLGTSLPRTAGHSGHEMPQVQFSSVAQSCLTLRPHESQHARPPCPSPTPGVYPKSCHRVGDAIQPSHPLSSQYAAMKGPCWQEVGTCQLPLQRLHYNHCKLLTFNTLWKEFTVEIRNKALCALGKPQKNRPSDSQMFSGKDFISPNSCIFSYLEKH